MNIEIRQLRYAVATADAKSFARAASMLNVKQITLSKRVQQLEDRLNVKMFERSTRGAKFTEHGRVCVQLARRIITDIDNPIRLPETSATASMAGSRLGFARA